MKENAKKFLCVLLAVLMMASFVPPVSYAINGGTGTLGSATVDCYPTVTYDSKTGEYTMHMELNAEFYDYHGSTDSQMPGRGFFTANYAGWYLVELWGGNGANGLNDGSRQGGSGGQGGYVYAKVYLEKDDTLYYSLGGNGSTTYTHGEGGGANGGGGGGSSVTYGVGGGGGYSALFLFEDSQYFADNYLDANRQFVGDNISEYDRATKYLMIAGGGGGGGAANGASLGGGTSWPANGGAGGSMTGSVTGSVAGTGTTVAGTYYAGSDGQSSGSSDNYIGHGGTAVPGDVIGTAWNWSTGEKPNDWTGAYNSAAAPGAGGAGNLRGGGGGGGFAGGSGGVQQSLVSPTNVGGGGGGASFIASIATGQPVITNLLNSDSDDPVAGINLLEQSILDGTHTSTTGGAVAITYLAEEQAQFSNLGNLNVSFQISKYFNVTGFSFTQSKATAWDDKGNPTKYNFSYTPNDDGTVSVVLNDISLLPTAENLTGHLGVTIRFKPKAVFAGGNDVPLLTGNTVTVAFENGSGTCPIELNPNNCCVNVPLNFTVLALNHVTNTTITLKNSDLYEDQYADVRTALTSGDQAPAYDFIAEIGSYQVSGLGGTPTEITQTTEYPVSFTVVPKDDPAINPTAGPQQTTTTFTKTALVTVLSLHEAHLHGQKVEFGKSLVYDEESETYTFSLNVIGDNSRESHLPVEDTPASAGDPYTVPHDGVYLVRVWGGNGRAGQDSPGLISRTGGAGGKGGFVYLILPLSAGDKLLVNQTGVWGKQPDNSGLSGTAMGGGGGTYSSVKLDYLDKDKTDIEHLLIAGGGGGGGNSISDSYVSLLGTNGTSCTGDHLTNAQLGNDLSVYNGGNGGVSSWSGWTPKGGTAGVQGANYIFSAGYTSYADYKDGSGNSLWEHTTEEDFNKILGDGTNPNTGKEDEEQANAGAILINCLELSTHEHVATNLQDYALDLQFSKYFDLVNMGTVEDPVYVTGVNNGAAAETAGETTLTFQSATKTGNLLQILDIDPFEDSKTTEEDGRIHYEGRIDFSVSIVLKAKDGFLGGNMVPVISYTENVALTDGGQISQTITETETTTDGEGNEQTVTKQVTKSAPISRNADADFANVKLHDSVTTAILGELDGKDVHLEDGGLRPVYKSELYSWTTSDQNPTNLPTTTQPLPDDWTADYLTTVERIGQRDNPSVSVGDGPYNVTGNTHYTVSVGIGPASTTAAKIGPQIGEVFLQDETNIFIRPRARFILDGLTTNLELGHDNCIGMDPEVNFEVILIPDEGHSLPDVSGITVVSDNGNNQAIPFAYDSATGKITIASSVIQRLVVQANGVKKTYQINYAYEVLGSTEPVIYTETYLYGASVTPWDYDPEVEGYSFDWRWYTQASTDNVAADGNELSVMPARDVWVVGTYTPNPYILRITYQLEQPNPNVTLPPVYQQQYLFGDSYDIASPAISGYAATPLYVRGTIDADLIAGISDNGIDIPVINLTVTYSPTTNRLRVNYVYEDTGVVDVVTSEHQTNASYTVDVTPPTGYTSWQEQGGVLTQLNENITGIMTAEGAVYNIVYRPEKYLVTLDADGGTCTENERTVVYNNTYDKIVDAGGEVKHLSLPTQVLRDGYTFVGWFLVDPNTDTVTDVEVTNETVVTIAEGHTLRAKWAAATYTLVTEHVYLNGTSAAPTEYDNVAYETPYTSSSVEIPGYESYRLDGSNYVKATQIETASMPAQTVVRTFYYIGKECPLTIYYYYYDANAQKEEAKTRIDNTYSNARFGDSYSVTSQEEDGYTCTQPVVSGTLDLLSELELVDGKPKGRQITVYYFANAPTISFEIQFGTLTYEYDRGTWNPATLQYEGGAIRPTEANADAITVINGDQSTAALIATLRYDPEPDYRQVSGQFTVDSNPVQQITVNKNSSTTVRLELSGYLSETLAGSVNSGTCTVTITAAGGD